MARKIKFFITIEINFRKINKFYLLLQSLLS